MLLAGLSLGVAAARTLWADKPVPPAPVLDQAIENKVRLYAEVYGLDAQETDRVRRRLQKHDQGVTALYRQLREEKKAAFQELIQATQADIDTILREAKARPPK
jgi:hypothetical protein